MSAENYAITRAVNGSFDEVVERTLDAESADNEAMPASL